MGIRPGNDRKKTARLMEAMEPIVTAGRKNQLLLTHGRGVRVAGAITEMAADIINESTQWGRRKVPKEARQELTVLAFLRAGLHDPDLDKHHKWPLQAETWRLDTGGDASVHLVRTGTERAVERLWDGEPLQPLDIFSGFEIVEEDPQLPHGITRVSVLNMLGRVISHVDRQKAIQRAAVLARGPVGSSNAC